MKGTLHYFLERDQCFKEIIINMFEKYASPNSLTSAQAIKALYDESCKQILNPEKSDDLEFLAELKAVTGRILDGDPFVLLFFPNVLQDEIPDSNETKDKYTAEIIGIDIYAVLYLLEDIGAEFVVVSTDSSLIIPIVFEIGETKLLKMQRKKTGTSDGVVLVPSDDKYLPTLHFITQADLAWIKENEEEPDDKKDDAKECDSDSNIIHFPNG